MTWPIKYCAFSQALSGCICKQDLYNSRQHPLPPSFPEAETLQEVADKKYEK
jgi:hypothetical protein